MEPPAEETDKPTDRPTNPPFRNSPVILVASTPGEEAKEPEECAGTPCPFAAQCRSQYGFCGVSFIYCNLASSWTLENCGLSGCDADVRKCPTGEFVHRDPSNECEYFPCPEEKGKENVITPSAFNIPAPRPRFPELPKPTLPKIEKPSPAVSEPTGIVDLGKKPTGNTKLVVIGKTEDVEDDKGVSTSANNEGREPEPNNDDNGFGGFSANDWVASGVHNMRQNPLILLALSILVIFTIW